MVGDPELPSDERIGEPLVQHRRVRRRAAIYDRHELAQSRSWSGLSESRPGADAAACRFAARPRSRFAPRCSTPPTRRRSGRRTARSGRRRSGRSRPLATRGSCSLRSSCCSEYGASRLDDSQLRADVDVWPAVGCRLAGACALWPGISVPLPIPAANVLTFRNPGSTSEIFISSTDRDRLVGRDGSVRRGGAVRAWADSRAKSPARSGAAALQRGRRRFHGRHDSPSRPGGADCRVGGVARRAAGRARAVRADGRRLSATRSSSCATGCATAARRCPHANATHHRMKMNGVEHDMLMPGMLSPRSWPSSTRPAAPSGIGSS